MNKKPAHLIIRKVLWSILLVLGIALTICGIVGIGNTSSEIGVLFVALSFCFGPALLVLAGCLVKWAFEAEFKKMHLEKEIYIQNKTGYLQEEYLSNNSDIKHRYLKKTARSIRQGLSVDVCPKCGDKVEANENFCSKCGTALYIKCQKCNTTNEANDEYCRGCGTKLKEQ